MEVNSRYLFHNQKVTCRGCKKGGVVLRVTTHPIAAAAQQSTHRGIRVAVAALALRPGFAVTIGAMRKLTPLLLLVLLGCPPNPPNPPPSPDADAAAPPPIVDAAPPPPPPSDAAPPPPPDACGAGEQNLLKLGCKDGRDRLIGGPNMHGVAWAQICRDNKANGVDMHPICIAVARSCPEVLSCR